MDVRQHLVYISAIFLLSICQVWLFNPVSLFGVATPLLYVYILFLFPYKVSRLTILLYGFMCGLLIDLLGNSLGLHTAALTATAFFRNPIATLFVSSDIEMGHFHPGLRSMGSRFYLFSLLITGLHTLLLFLLDAWSLFDPFYFTVRTLSSWAATFVLSLVLYFLFGRREIGK